MYKVVKEVSWCAAHRLLDHKGPCKNIHGHSYRALFTIQKKKLNDMGMIIDFTDLKHLIQGWIDEHWDHSVILHEKDPMISVFKNFDNKIFVLKNNPTAENMAKYLFVNFSIVLGGFDVELVSVEVFETITSSAIYEK